MINESRRKASYNTVCRYMQIHTFTDEGPVAFSRFCGGHDRSAIRCCGGLQISGPSLVLDIPDQDEARKEDGPGKKISCDKNTTSLRLWN